MTMTMAHPSFYSADMGIDTGTGTELPSSSSRCQRQRQIQNQKQLRRRRSRPGSRPSTSLLTGVLTFTTLSLGFSSSNLANVGVRAAEQNLTTAQVDIVVRLLNESALRSWEVGTEQQALTELSTPSLSVLNDSFLPPSSSLPSSYAPVLQSITEVIQNKTRLIQQSNDTLSSPQPFWPEDGSAADPASNGVAALVANWTGQEGVEGVDYGGAAGEQMEYLWTKVPRTEDGALSHRVSQVQLWSDFIYMVPPFLAYYGVLTSNRSMLHEAYTQIALYRSYLRDSDRHSDTHNLWRHVVMGDDFEDLGVWSTGNGWAAAGMLRVLGTIKNSEYANAMKSEVGDLREWVDEILEGMYGFMRDDGMFHNYANDSSTFVDAASTALLASTVYRHALLTQSYHYLPHAEFVRRALWAPSSNSSSSSSSSTNTTPSFSSNPNFSQNTTFVNASSLQNMTHFDSEGWLTPVVNPHSFGEEGEKSAEAQAFVVMMYAAWRDWADEGAVGANAAGRMRGEVPGVGVVVGVLVGLALGMLIG